jgi:hypothetical protein
MKMPRVIPAGVVALLSLVLAGSASANIILAVNQDSLVSTGADPILSKDKNLMKIDFQTSLSLGGTFDIRIDPDSNAGTFYTLNGGGGEPVAFGGVTDGSITVVPEPSTLALSAMAFRLSESSLADLCVEMPDATLRRSETRCRTRTMMTGPAMTTVMRPGNCGTNRSGCVACSDRRMVFSVPTVGGCAALVPVCSFLHNTLLRV